jgi:hypothetical protein
VGTSAHKKKLYLIFVTFFTVKRNLLGQRRDYWGALEVIDRISPDAFEIGRSVKNLPGIK